MNESIRSPGDEEAARYARDVAVTDLRDNMTTFADLLEKVKFGKGEGVVAKRTEVTFKRKKDRVMEELERAWWVKAHPLTYARRIRDKPSEDPPGWQDYAADDDSWERGHLLSEHLPRAGIELEFGARHPVRQWSDEDG